MAEDLGHIKIDFGDMGTGPEPTRSEGEGGGSILTRAGATIGMALGGPVGAAIGAAVGKLIDKIMEVVGKALRQIIDLVQKAYRFVESAAQQFRERGKYSPEVMFENVAAKVQQIQQQVREAQVLGPLYAMVLRWYRELMRLLEPWKMLFQAILAFITGTILAVFNAILTQLNKALPAILQGIITILEILQAISGFFALFGNKIASVGTFLANPAMGLGGMIGQALGMTTPTSVLGNVFSSVGASVFQITTQLQSVLQGITQIANNTAPQGNGADWAASQLREIASISPLYGITGQPAYATPGGQAPFFRPPGSTYP